MRPVTLFAFAFGLAVSATASANEQKPLTLKVPKAALVANGQAIAPFAMPVGGEPELAHIVAQRDLRQEQSRSSCTAASTLCYDADERRIVYKPARNFMPDLPGLTRENISVKRDRIVFKYTF